jgi:hypothetical protein
MRILDPLADSLGALRGLGDELRILRARVRADEAPLPHGRHKGTPCLVIDYEGDDSKPSTWVASKSGLVMCQEATLDSNHWALYRD